MAVVVVVFVAAAATAAAPVVLVVVVAVVVVAAVVIVVGFGGLSSLYLTTLFVTVPFNVCLVSIDDVDCLDFMHHKIIMNH